MTSVLPLRPQKSSLKVVTSLLRAAAKAFPEGLVHAGGDEVGAARGLAWEEMRIACSRRAAVVDICPPAASTAHARHWHARCSCL